MKKLLKFPFLLLLVLVSEGLTSCVASAQTAVVGPPPRYYGYGPRYYRPRPARVVVVPPPPVYVRPRPVIVAPAPGYYHYNGRPHRYVRVR
ncbi:hypothetical protein [Hymenobacter chitinivorans]|uniref:PXPV repeat-containing protein n=1 Tax=Hymenobacter chitinivorans DSM 11115 TaxID=1121954 RepID=A0A2M9BLI3_9BACT|nr:hypothetical protein [Hymenobacter chitinivorans]PJJ58803.1 hypothetical protein CLV45_0213 [Hymenobacter chitinivorans DSM 11115]